MFYSINRGSNDPRKRDLMIFQITCIVAAAGFIEPEVAELLSPELRPMLLENKTAHSWRWLFALSADDEGMALKFFADTFKAKVGDREIYFTDEVISER